MRIWQCTRLNVQGIGGVEKHIAEVSAGLTRRGHEVHIGATLPAAWGPDGGIIVHTHGDSWPNPMPLRNHTWIHVCHGTSIGRVIACREFLSVSGWRGSVRDFYPTHLATAAVAVGQNALDEARRYFQMHLHAKVIRNGADPAIFFPLKQISMQPRIIFVGRGEDRVKNLPSLISACQRVHHDHSDFQLWTAPGIDYDYTVHPFVRNLGLLKGLELANALAQCRALVLVSYYEGDPIVLHEAMAMGLPVVASDIAQLRSTLDGYANAIFVNPRNVESIAFGIKTALFGSVLTPTPVVRTWDQVATEFEDFYKEVIARAKK